MMYNKELFCWVRAWVRINRENQPENKRCNCNMCKYFDGYYKGKVTCELVDKEPQCGVLKKDVIE